MGSSRQGCCHQITSSTQFYQCSTTASSIFHLCYKCMETEHQTWCTHENSERELEGTWFSPELDLAVQMGYQVIKIYEAWYWPPEQRSKDFYKPIIRRYYQKKALASKVPQDPTELEHIIKEYRDTMELDLKTEDFQENPAMRFTAKISLNSIWSTPYLLLTPTF